MALKEGDFVEIEYIGKIQGSDVILDTTSLEKDKKGTIIVCLGHKSILKSLEDKLVGKEVGKDYKIDLNYDEAFGKKDPSLIKIIPTKVFIEKKVNPMPGLQVNIDGTIATIRSVSGGRCVVDFNHPLAGRNLTYDVKIIKYINDLKEKVSGIIKLDFPFIGDFKLENDNLTLYSEMLDNKIKDIVKERILELLPEIKNISFEELKKEDKIQ